MITSRREAIKNAKNKMILLAEKYALKIEAEIEIALDVSNALASNLASFKKQNYLNIGRPAIRGMLKDILKDNSIYLGIGTLWEPNAFDNKDSKFVNKEGHDNT